MTPGDRLGSRYELGAPVADGMYLGRDLRSGGTVGIKVFPRVGPALSAFRLETAIAIRARHANLVGMLDAGVSGSWYWLVTEYVPGMEMRHRLRRLGAMGARHALDIAAQLFAGLEAMHRLGLFHGDIKPDNLLLEGGRVRLFDYGVGRLQFVLDRAPGPYPGTPDYMHPDLFAGGVPDERTDCFAAWVTTYELLKGARPYTVGQLKEGRLPPPVSVGDAALDRLLAAGLSGQLGTARTCWLAASRYKRQMFALPRPTPPRPPPPAEAVEDALARARAGESAVFAGPRDIGRSALEAVYRRWLKEGGRALWGRADWAADALPMGGALTVAGQAIDTLDDATLASLPGRLGPMAAPLSAVLPSARAWLGAPPDTGRPAPEQLVVALARLFDVCPRPLLVLVDGLDRMDGASRRFLAALATSRSVTVLGTSTVGAPHGLAREIPLPGAPEEAGSDDAELGEFAELVGQAREFGLPFGDRLAAATGESLERVEEAALVAEAAGCARWDGVEVSASPGPPAPRHVVERWCRAAAARLDPAQEPLLMARFAAMGRDDTLLAAVLEPAVEAALRVDPALALKLVDQGPPPTSPEQILRRLHLALLARNLPAARRLLAQMRSHPDATAADRAECEGEIAFRTGETVPAIRAFREAAAALGSPIANGLWGTLQDVAIALRVRFSRPLAPAPNKRLARILERLYDLHFCWDTAPLLRIHALWRRADPDGARARSMDVVFRTALGMVDAAREAEARLRAEIREDRDPVGAAVVLFHAGIARLWRGETIEAFAEGLDASERLLRVGDPFLGALASSVVWVGGFHLAAVGAMERLRMELATLVEATGDRRAGAWLSGASAITAWLRGDTRAAWEAATSWAADAERREDSSGILARRYLGELALERGDLDEAVQELRRCDALARHYHVRFDWTSASVLGLLTADARLRLAGRSGLRDRWWLRQRLAWLVRASPRWAPRARVAMAWQRLAAGQPAAAASLFDAGEHDAIARQQHHDAWFAMRERALALGDDAAAERAAAHAERHGIKQGNRRPASESADEPSLDPLDTLAESLTAEAMVPT